jgi:hypothetical protein
MTMHQIIRSENHPSPDAAAARVRELRNSSVHAWRSAWREPLYGSEFFDLLTVVHYYDYVYDEI